MLLHGEANTTTPASVFLVPLYRTYAKLRWLGAEAKAVQLHGEPKATTPASIFLVPLYRTYAKLRWLGAEAKTVLLHGEPKATTPASIFRKSKSLLWAAHAVRHHHIAFVILTHIR